MINTIVDFIKSNTGELVTLWGAFITLVYVVIRLTPSKKDDEILDNILKVLTVLQLNPLNEQEQQSEGKVTESDLEEEINEKDNDKSRTNIINAIK